MAKHVTQRSTVRLAGWIWVVIIALLLIAAAGGVVAFLLHRDRIRSVTNCTGSIELIIAADPSTRGRADATVTAFNETHPAVKDTCITPRIIEATTYQAATLLNSDAALIPAVWISTDPFALTTLTGTSGDADSAIEIGQEEVGALAPSSTGGTDGSSAAPSAGTTITSDGSTNSAGESDRTSTSASTAATASATRASVSDPASTVALPFDTSLSYIIAAERYLAAHPEAATDSAITQMQANMNAALTSASTTTAEIPAASSVVTEAAKLVLPIGRETVASSSESVIALQNSTIPGHDGLIFTADSAHPKVPIIATMMSSSRAVGENQARAALEFERFISQSTGTVAFYGDGTAAGASTSKAAPSSAVTASSSARSDSSSASATTPTSDGIGTKTESIMAATPAQALARLIEFTNNPLPAVSVT